MSKSTVLILILIAGTIIFGAGIFFLSINKSSQTNNTNSSPTQVAVPSHTATSSNTSIVSPIDIYSPTLRSVAINYQFDTSVQNLSLDSKGTKITTPLNVPNLPDLVIEPSTQILFNAQGKNRGAKISDIIPGSNVRIYLNYNLISHAWKVGRVDIFVISFPISPTPSPTPKK